MERPTSPLFNDICEILLVWVMVTYFMAMLFALATDWQINAKWLPLAIIALWLLIGLFISLFYHRTRNLSMDDISVAIHAILFPLTLFSMLYEPKKRTFR